MAEEIKIADSEALEVQIEIIEVPPDIAPEVGLVSTLTSPLNEETNAETNEINIATTTLPDTITLLTYDVATTTLATDNIATTTNSVDISSSSGDNSITNL